MNEIIELNCNLIFYTNVPVVENSVNILIKKLDKISAKWYSLHGL